MIPTLIRRAAAGPKPPAFNVFTNPYKTKKVWPPDFSKLSRQEQFRYEKRFKRRVQVLAQRPKLTKIIKLTQLFSITFVVIYCALFLDRHLEKQPFNGFRTWFWGIFESFHPPEPRASERGSMTTADDASPQAVAK